MTKQEQFQRWAKEINETWIDGYVATATECSLIVKHDGVPVGEITDKFKVMAGDPEVKSQLEYMVNR